MNNKSNPVQTPKNVRTRCLGLRRSCIKSTPRSSTDKNKDTPPPANSQKAIQAKTCKSEMKLGSFDGGQASPSTPCGSVLKRQAASTTNARPYRLTLSKKLRESMSKKRLFQGTTNDGPNDTDKEDNAEAEAACGVDASELEMTENRDVLVHYIKMAENELKACQDHVKKVQEFKESIDTWQSAFRSALDQLRSRMDPKPEKAELVKKIGIPEKMVKYLEE